MRGAEYGIGRHLCCSMFLILYVGNDEEWYVMLL